MNDRYFALHFVATNDHYWSEHDGLLPIDAQEGRYDGVPLDIAGPLRLPRARGRLAEYLNNLGMWLVLRSDVVETLVRHDPDHFQLFEVSVDRVRAPKYHLVNVLGNIDAVDDEASNVTMAVPGIRVYSTVDGLVLDPQAVGGRHVFRLATYRTALIVSESVKDSIERLDDIELARFTPLDEVRFPPPFD